MNRYLVLSSVLASTLVLGACTPSTTPTETSNQTPPTSAPTTKAMESIAPSASPNAMMPKPSASPVVGMLKAGVREFDVEMGSFYFKPNVIKVKKGEKVKINFTAKDMMHNFMVDELGVKSATFKAGEKGSVEFTANKVGTFESYCAVGQHRKNGQVGTVIVE